MTDVAAPDAALSPGSAAPSGDPPPELPTEEGAGHPQGPRLCPYVLTAGGWRSRTETREHRCTAVDPPVRLAAEKQRALCLVTAHETCATFVAATEAREALGVARDRRPIARTAPVVLERARPLLPVDLGGAGRRWGQAGLVVLMVLALAAVVLARSGSGPASALLATPTPSPAVTPSIAPSVEVTPAPTSAAVETGPLPSTTAAATPPPSGPVGAPTLPPATRTYTVKAGDNLSAIAAKYGTTVAILQRLNGIQNPSLIRIGQVLRIP